MPLFALYIVIVCLLQLYKVNEKTVMLHPNYKRQTYHVSNVQYQQSEIWCYIKSTYKQTTSYFRDNFNLNFKKREKKSAV